MKQNCLILLIILMCSAHSNAQDSITDQEVKVNQQLWLDYNFKNRIGDSTLLSTQVGFRKITPEVYNRFLATSTLEFNNKGLDFLNLETPLVRSFQLGLGLIYTQNYNDNDNLELRLIQGFKFNIPTLKRINLSNYVRLEERFQYEFNNSGWTAGYRIRYRISTNLAWNQHLFKFSEGFYIPLSFEMFFNLKKADRFNDVVRIAPGIGYKINKDWRFEVYLIFNESKNNTATINGSSDFILRIRVFNDALKKKSNVPDPLD